MKEKDVDLRYVFFGEYVENSFITSDDFFYEGSITPVNKVDLEKEANRIESVFDFTFKQAYYPDILKRLLICIKTKRAK